MPPRAVPEERKTARQEPAAIYAMHAATVAIHPLVIVGWCGLTTTAFNMLPVGCLDGGRALQGAFGKDALFGVLGGPLSLPWGLYVLICQRTPEKPCLKDVSDVGTWRGGQR